MDLAFTDLQDELRAQARGFLEATPEPAWEALAELGWTGAGVAEEHGGAGLSFLEEAVIHEEAGRALLHAPLVCLDLFPALARLELPVLSKADELFLSRQNRGLAE